jgi:hypothetical protein
MLSVDMLIVVVLSLIMLNSIKLKSIVLNSIMLSVVMLNVIILSIVELNVVMLSRGALIVLHFLLARRQCKKKLSSSSLTLRQNIVFDMTSLYEVELTFAIAFWPNLWYPTLRVDPSGLAGKH